MEDDRKSEREVDSGRQRRSKEGIHGGRKR